MIKAAGRLVVVGLFCVTAAPCWALTPESPEVRQAVDRALAFLETGEDGRLGAQALVGLSFLKAHQGEHPLVADSARRIRSAIPPSRDPADFSVGTWDIYSTGLALIFLCSYDPITYREDIQSILGYLERRQKPHGGWGYPEDQRYGETGDTSQTQYAVLGLWEAIQAGIPVNTAMVDRVTRWLAKTQDPSGGFGYQGQPAPGFEPIRQQRVRIGMGVAGTASMYVCASLAQRIDEPAEDDDLPPAVRKIERGRQQGPVRLSVDPGIIRNVLNRGNAYIRENFEVAPGMYNYYHLYTLERYFTFRELVDGNVGPFNDWYDQGAYYLLDTQAEDGSWMHSVGTYHCGPVPDTAFGILFLVRSTRQAVQRARDFGPGVLVGGRGLPKTTQGVRVKDGQVVALPVRISAEELLAVLDDPHQSGSLEKLQGLAELPPEKRKLFVSENAEKFRRLAGDPSPEARLAAVKALATAGDLDLVPVLIYAMTDPDPNIVLEADRALRRLSRRLGPGLPEDFTETQRDAAIQQWKAWYRSIRPDAELGN